MKPTVKLWIAAIAGVVIVAGLLYFAMSVSYNNRSIGYKNSFTAQEQRIENSYDEMWKTIAQTAEVDQSYRDSVIELVSGYAEQRGGAQGASFATLLQEVVPTMDSATAQRLMGVIDGRREQFKRDQEVLVAIARENNDMVAKFPGSLFLNTGGMPVPLSNPLPDGYQGDLLYAEIVSSSRSKGVMETRMDDDVAVFSKE